MTNSLKSIFDKLDKLPSAEQDAIADLLAHELAWQNSFAKSQNQLLSLAKEAKAEYVKGKTKPMNLK
ncbi:MAG: hypothetical protein POELPBGB_01542 [Bacteroidia bacterium]|nr:hypothetical protein [Bacteroidia bacterium]